MIRPDVLIALGEISADDARARYEAHHLSLDWSGDSFMAHLWQEATQQAVLVDDEPVGLACWTPDDGGHLSLLTLDRSAVALDRQVMECVLAETGVRAAYLASWDTNHVATFGAFGTGMGSQAYQFRLLDPGDLREPLPGLSLALATHADLDYLESTGWQSDFASYVERSAMSVVRLDGAEAGIAVHEPHAIDPSVVDIGMYVDPVLRRRGVGSSILALTARAVLDQGSTPVAGCWWKNWSSRATLEAAGLVCAGTILRFDLDPDLFADVGG
ncbi:MAG: GNAT family N-acetyltransferase [Nocardioides sp.]